MQGKEYDISIAKQRFEDYDVDKSGNITLVEFISKYLWEETYYKQEIQMLKRMIEESENQKVALISKLNEAKVNYIM